MSEDPLRFDKLETLRKAAWESFSSRRPIEWRVSLSLWGFLAAFIVALMSEKAAIELSPKLAFILISVLSAFPILHVLWLVGIVRAHTLDRMEEEQFRVEMRTLSGCAETPEIGDQRKRITAQRKYALINWNYGPQLVATLLLVGLAFVVVAVRTG